MYLEEVLQEHRAGREVRRKCWRIGVYLERPIILGESDLNADDWELVPKPPVVIDLVEYADGYEFVFGAANHQIYINEIDCFKTSYNRAQMSVGGVVYMNQEQAEILILKLNSGEWVLK